MAYLHAHSCECLKSELDLFTLPPTQTSIESGQWVEYKPVAAISDDAPIEFVVPGHGDEYLDLAHTMIRVSARTLRKESGTSPEQPHIVLPVNNFLHSMFNQVDVYFNQKLVSPSNNAYAYRAYLETLLNYGDGAKNTHLTCGMWYSDAAGKFEELSGNDNPGAISRILRFGGHDPVDMIGRLHSDVFNQEKFLLNGVELRLRLVKSRDAFCLMEANDLHKTDIMDVTLLVRRVKISPGILLAHAQTLAKSTAKYPMTRVEVKSMTIHAGVQAETLDNVFLGQLPKRIIIGFVDNKAYNGDKKYNPFNFANFGLNYLSLYVEGTQYPSKPLQPNFTKKLYADSYNTLFTGTGIHFLNEGNTISREDYHSGYCLTAFDLTPDLSASDNAHWNLIKHGSVRIETRFAEALTTTINCIVYAEFDNVIEIDAMRQVITDFGN